MKRLIIFIIIFLSISLLSNTLIYNYKAFYFSDEWLDEKILKDLGFSYVLNEKLFMAKNNDLFIGKNGNITLNFEKTFQNAYKVENRKLYINSKFLKEYFNLQETTLESGAKIYYDKLPELIRVDYKNNNLSLVFTSEITLDLIKSQVIDKTLHVLLSPITGEPLVFGKVSIEKSFNAFEILISGDMLKPVPIISIKKRTVDIEIKFTEEEKQTIKDGLVWERKIENYNNQKFLVNYLHIDPKKVEIKPLISSKGIGTREDLREMLQHYNFIAGINANYFDPSSNIPIDLVIIDGKLLSDKFGLRPAFIITDTNDVFIKRILVELYVNIGDLLFLVKGVNTNAKGEVLLYTSEYGLKIPFDSDKIYFLIQNNWIVAREYFEKVPDDSYILAINKKYEKYLINIDVGTKVTFNLNSNFELPIKHAIAAGPFLIENGQPIEDSDVEKLSYGNGLAFSKTTRTIIAITKDNKVDFIVIEGYNNSPGMNYDMAVEFLLNKGYVSAMMLDGGGSSAMVVNNKVVNQDGEIQRGIPVGIGIK
ncbi:MAG: phosphodiester glycosidase family protein [Thermosipho sp. (in: Bacteria)]|nr:phosphodiester glycosidase family protein [Thermosipho sp. (in: thermotogales)]